MPDLASIHNLIKSAWIQDTRPSDFASAIRAHGHDPDKVYNCIKSMKCAPPVLTALAQYLVDVGMVEYQFSMRTSTSVEPCVTSTDERLIWDKSMFVNESSLRVFFTYYIAVQFPHYDRSVRSLMQLTGPYPVEMVEKVVFLLDGMFQDESSDGSYHWNKFRAFLTCQLSQDFNLASINMTPVQPIPDDLMLVMHQYDNMMPFWIVTGGSGWSHMMTKIRMVLCSADEMIDKTDKDCAALILARLYLEYSRCDLSIASEWLRSLDTCIMHNIETNGTNNSHLATEQGFSSSFFTSLLSLPNSLNHIIDYALEQNLHPNSTTALISKISSISCSATLTLLVCAHQLHEISDSIYGAYTDHIIKTLFGEIARNVEMSPGTSVNCLVDIGNDRYDPVTRLKVCLRFVHRIYTHFVCQSRININLMLDRICNGDLAFRHAKYAHVLHRSIFRSRGTSAFLGRVLGRIASGKDANMMGTMTLVLATGNPLEVFESLVTDIFSECIYEQPTEMYSHRGAVLVRTLTGLVMRMAVDYIANDRACGTDVTMATVAQLAYSVKKLTLQLCGSEVAAGSRHALHREDSKDRSDQSCLISRCDFAIRFLQVLMHASCDVVDGVRSTLQFSKEETTMLQHCCPYLEIEPQSIRRSTSSAGDSAKNYGHVIAG